MRERSTSCQTVNGDVNKYQEPNQQKVPRHSYTQGWLDGVKLSLLPPLLSEEPLVLLVGCWWPVSSSSLQSAIHSAVL